MIHFITRFVETARKNWDTPALCDYKGAKFTYADIATQIARLHLIFEKWGIAAGDKIALCSKNTAHWAIAYLAATSYRAVAVPILNGFTPDNLEKLADHSDSKLLFTEKEMWSEMNGENMPQLVGAINMEDYSVLYSRDGRLETAVADAERMFAEKYPDGMKPELMEYETGKPEDIITISYTSGTTSSPKGIMLSVRNISSNISFGVKRIQFPKGGNIVSMLPLAHLYGLAFEFVYPVASGGCVYFLGKTPTPTILLQAFADVKPYMLITVPLVVEKIFRNKVMPILERPAMRIATSVPIVKGAIYGAVRRKVMAAFGGKMKHIIIGGAAVNSSIETVMKKVGIPYTVGYGMTECGPLISFSIPAEFKNGSCGRYLKGLLEAHIDSADPEHTPGEILIRGEHVMAGYYKNEEATKAAFTADGWMRTGDLGLLDKDGNIYIKGRSKNMILTANGQNIYPEEVEELLNAMPHVKESIVIERNKHIVAIVSAEVDAANPLSREQLDEAMKSSLAALNRELPSYCQITGIEILDGDFERTPKNSVKRYLYK